MFDDFVGNDAIQPIGFGPSFGLIFLGLWFDV
jgi:hypothetical protein